jgi:hypothetical protein
MLELKGLFGKGFKKQGSFRLKKGLFWGFRLGTKKKNRLERRFY